MKSPQTDNLLPEGFEELEEFVPQWDAMTSHERWVSRPALPYSEIVRFYEAMSARAEEATCHVEQYSLDSIPEDAARLFRLILALMHAAIAVEVHQDSRVPFSPLPHSLRLEQGIPPFG